MLKFLVWSWESLHGAIVAGANSADDKQFWVSVLGHKPTTEWLRALVLYLGLLALLQLAWALELFFITCLACCGSTESNSARREREDREHDLAVADAKIRQLEEARRPILRASTNGYARPLAYA